LLKSIERRLPPSRPITRAVRGPAPGRGAPDVADVLSLVRDGTAESCSGAWDFDRGLHPELGSPLKQGAYPRPTRRNDCLERCAEARGDRDARPSGITHRRDRGTVLRPVVRQNTRAIARGVLSRAGTRSATPLCSVRLFRNEPCPGARRTGVRQAVDPGASIQQ
jgi:hypothetical protein